MRNACRPLGRFFCLLMWLAAAIAMAAQTNGPAMTQVTEGLMGHKTGAAKKNAALALVNSAITATDAVAGKDIVDPTKFQAGLGQVIDGLVACLNSSAWAKTKSA